MAAVALWLRAQARKRWRTWFALALVLGASGGAGIAAAAGSRRTETAYPRFVERNRGFDVILGGIASEDHAERAKIFQDIIHLPEVAAYSTGGLFVTDRIILRPSGQTISFPEILIGGILSSRDLEAANRPKVIAGRLFDPNATDEAVLDFTVAERLGIHVGQRFEVPLANQETGASAIRIARLVGIIASPWDLPAVGQLSLSGLTLSPGFLRANAAYVAPSDDAPSVRLRYGVADIPSFIKKVEGMASEVDVPATLPHHLEGVRKTLGFEVSALWILCGIIGLAALAIVGQALARQATTDADDHTILAALAMSRRQLFAVGMIRAAVIGLGASAVAVGVAILASPLTPRGLARVVEPDPGFAADWLVLGVGAAATLAIALIASAIPAWRAAGARAPVVAERGSRVARGLANAGASPSVVAGARLALEPGRGGRALPVRSTIAGIAVALAAFWGAAIFTQSLDHLIATPALQGYAWDAITTGPTQQALADALRADPDVVAASPGGATNIVIRGEHLIPFTYEPGKISPVMLEGRAPRRPDEIALGTRALRAFHKRVGDSIDVDLDVNEPDYPHPGPQRFRIVGATVVPPFFFMQVEPGFGSAITNDGYFRLDPQSKEHAEGDEGLPYIVRYRRGVDVRAKLEALRRKLGSLFTIQVRQPGAELAGVSRSSGLPLTLTEILLFMAAATLVHALVTAVRKRRHDLAILKTLGFSRRQVRTAVAWQTSTLVVIALAVGLPVGTALGRWAWKWFVDTVGLVPQTIMPAAYVVAFVVALTMVFGNGIAVLPGRSAARTSPASILRTE